MNRLPLTCALLALLLAACASGGVESNKRVVRSMIEAFNERDLEALDQLVAADVARHSAATPGLVVTNLEQFKDFLRADFAAVPNSVQEIQLLFADEEYVALRAFYRGVQSGPFGPFPPSPVPFELPFLAILRIEHGKVAEIWVEWDNLSLLTKLGHLPPPG